MQSHLRKWSKVFAFGCGHRCSSSTSQRAEVADTLRLVQLLQTYRSHGHLSATLDPLQRLRGPWFTECQDWTPPRCAPSTVPGLACMMLVVAEHAARKLSFLLVCRSAILDRIANSDGRLPPDEKAAWLAAQLGMELPTTASRYAPRTFCKHGAVHSFWLLHRLSL